MALDGKDCLMILHYPSTHHSNKVSRSFLVSCGRPVEPESHIYGGTTQATAGVPLPDFCVSMLAVATSHWEFHPAGQMEEAHPPGFWMPTLSK